VRSLRVGEAFTKSRNSRAACGGAMVVGLAGVAGEDVNADVDADKDTEEEPKRKRYDVRTGPRSSTGRWTGRRPTQLLIQRRGKPVKEAGATAVVDTRLDGRDKRAACTVERARVPGLSMGN